MPSRFHDFTVPDHQTRRSYDSNQNEEFVGIASPTALTSESRWRIMQRKYDNNQNEISEGMPRLDATSHFSAEFIYEWDERANLVYSND